jgi:tight adherence protein B
MNRWFLAVASSLTVGLVTGSIILAACSGLAAVAIGFELSARAATRRHNLVATCWPEVLDSFASAAASGLGTVETFADLATMGPHQTRTKFTIAVDGLDRGIALDDVLDELKLNFREAYPDRLFELVRLVSQLGGSAYTQSLRGMAQDCRTEMALDGEIAAKQGWIGGTAKLAIASPWIIVILLSVRPENVAAYNSAPGFVVLITGLAVSLVAYRLIHVLGALPSRPRVFQ